MHSPLKPVREQAGLFAQTVSSEQDRTFFKRRALRLDREAKERLLLERREGVVDGRRALAV